MANMSPEDFARRTQFKATLQTLRGNLTQEGLFQFSERSLEFTQKMMGAVAEKSDPLACQAGCVYCCFLMATVSGPEALTIAKRLQKSLSSDAFEEIKDKVKDAYQVTRKMNNLSRAKAGIACPFLDEEGLCSIYEHRPLDCATYHSLDVQACKEALDMPERSPPMNPVMKSIGVGIKTGLGHGINQVGLEAPALRYELIEAVHICLHDRKVTDKYLAGKNPLQSAAIVRDQGDTVTYKLRYAPARLKTEAERVIADERRAAHRLHHRRKDSGKSLH